MEGIVFEGMSVINIRDMSYSYHFLYFYEVSRSTLDLCCRSHINVRILVAGRPQPLVDGAVQALRYSDINV